MCNIKRQKVTNDAAHSEHGVFCTSPWLDQFGGGGWGGRHCASLAHPSAAAHPLGSPPGPPAFTAALPLRSHFTSTPKCTHWGLAAAPRLPGPAHGGPFRATSRGHSRVLDTTGLTLLVETPLSLRVSGVTLPIPCRLLPGQRFLGGFLPLRLSLHAGSAHISWVLFSCSVAASCRLSSPLTMYCLHFSDSHSMSLFPDLSPLSPPTYPLLTSL